MLETMSSDSSEDEEFKKPVEEIRRNSSSESSYDEEEIEDKARVDQTKMGDEHDELHQPPKPRRKRFVPKYNVDGVFILELGEETQIAVECVIGLHVSAQYPWKTVEKAKIMESIEIGMENSEFFAIKKQLEEYDEPEVLLGYIVDESKDTDEFYVCVTKEARDHCKQQSDRFIKRQEKKLDKAVQKKPRPWTTLGSEADIYELVPVNSRTLIELEIITKFPTAYQPKAFMVRDTNSCRDGLIELTPYRQKFSNVLRRRVDCATQAAAPRIDSAAQTVLRFPQNKWTQSIADALGAYTGDNEGGGDAGKDLMDQEDEEVSTDSEAEGVFVEPPDEIGLLAYKQALLRMRRTSYIKKMNSFVTGMHKEMDSILELNTVMDIYCNDYPNLIKNKKTDVYNTMTFEEYVCFTDVRAKDKYVSSAVFHPMWTGIVAISYADASPAVMKTVSTRPDPIQRAVYGLNPVMIWSHIDSLMPKLYLESPREVKKLSFCPFNENLLIGGCVNGQIVVWDITNKLENVEKMEVLSETREKYRIAMNAHMGWMKSVQDKTTVVSTVLTNLLTSHYGAVTTIKWLSPNFSLSATGQTELIKDEKKSCIFLTGSEDGDILVWNLSTENISSFIEGKKIKKSKRVPIRPPGLTVDVSPLKILDRNLQPCYKINLGTAGQLKTFVLQSFGFNVPKVIYNYAPRNPGSGRKYFSCEIVSQTESEINTKLYVGSQHGQFRKVAFEGHNFNTGELVNSEYCDLLYNCNIHDGIVTWIQKNPFLNHLILSVGGKIFAIWSDKLEGRPLVWKKRPSRLTDAKWSMYKPSILFIATAEGDLETWDLLLRSDQPISVQTVSGSMLTGVSLHSLPLVKNIIGVSDLYGSFRMFLCPPIFMINNPRYIDRMEALMQKDLKVMQSFTAWQNDWNKEHPEILLEMKRKEGLLLAEKEAEKRRIREAEDQRLEDEAEALRLEKLKVIGPAERWQMILQKLIERTIAVKKRINRAQLIEHEKPLRELESQRLEKERRMFDIMKNQNTIFNDTVAILFPEAIKKEDKVRKSFLGIRTFTLKKECMEDYSELKRSAMSTVRDNPYKVPFSWEATLNEGKERRQALNAYEGYVNWHRARILEGGKEPARPSAPQALGSKESEVELIDAD